MKTLSKKECSNENCSNPKEWDINTILNSENWFISFSGSLCEVCKRELIIKSKSNRLSINEKIRHSLVQDYIKI